MTSRQAGGSTLPPDDPPLVTVVVPAYNAGRYVADAVRSVLRQSWPSWECIVVDDGSTDDTAAVVSGFDDPRVRLLRQPNRGVARARNAGLAAGRGEFFAFLDADDVWLPTKLERQLRLARASPDVGLVLTGYAVADEDLRPLSIVRGENPRERLCRWLLLEADGPGFGSTALVRRAVLDDVPGFDPLLPPSEDLQFATAAASRFAVAAVPEPLMLYRTHPRQGHRDLPSFEQHMLRIYELHLAGPSQRAVRRRALGNLYARLFFHHLARGRLPAAMRAFLLAGRQRPDRLIVLPMRVGGRRLASRLRRRLLGLPRLTDESTERDEHVGDVGHPRHEPAQ